MNALKVELTGRGRGRVLIDGAELKDVTAIEIKTSVGCANAVTITLLATTVEVDGMFDVTTIGDDARKYVAGNNPP